MRDEELHARCTIVVLRTLNKELSSPNFKLSTLYAKTLHSLKTSQAKRPYNLITL